MILSDFLGHWLPLIALIPSKAASSSVKSLLLDRGNPIGANLHSWGNMQAFNAKILVTINH